MKHLMPRLKVLPVMLVMMGMQVVIWVFLPAISLWLAAGASLLWALATTKFFTTGPNINFVTPLWVRNDDLFFINCVLAGVNPGLIRRLYRFLPSDPRCRFCLMPFEGFGKWLRVEPSKKNPNFCQSCIEYAPIGVYDMEVGVIFADIRGYTAWTAEHSPREASERLGAYRRIANRVFTKEDVFVEFVGDEVMVLFFPAFPSIADRVAEKMIESGQRFQAAIASEFGADELGVGVGINLGMASVGNVGDTYSKDFTAAGDVINTGARLQSCAKAGEIVLADTVYDKVASDFPRAKAVSFEVKGKAEPLSTHVLEPLPSTG